MRKTNMWKIKLSLIIAVILTSVSCITDVTVESGVSRELALQRKTTVSNVVYNLSFNVDSLLDTKPYGAIEIRFDYKPCGEPLQLDFAGESINSLTVNGIQITTPIWQEGHIVIAAEYLTTGENTVSVEFIAADRALNRNPGYMYTLFVPNRAHSVFPCFDQPDEKGCYNLTLTVPKQWKAVGNSPVLSSVENSASNTRTIKFGPTEPLSTYLFAFAAGEFEYSQHTENGRTIGAYYRESDPDRLAQLNDIFTQVESSLRQLEEYTGIAYPFAKYDLVILPGFQFGGMEHTGATFYNDNSLFLSKNATAASHLSRAKLIAHETSHMWFGDYVTMEWFNDVWTKEVFANFFAARLVRELMPEFDHDLEWLRVYMSASLDQDRSGGSTPIRQELDNLKNAGLIYNNIIYNKSPLMMGKLAEITGEENFRKGIIKYLNDHAYGNATWDDLISALSTYSSKDIENFSRVWVYEEGMPRIDFSVKGNKLIVKQIDSRKRNIVWPQTFDVVITDGNNTETVNIKFDGTTDKVEVAADMDLKSDSLLILPAADGRAYGLLTTSAGNLSRMMRDALCADGAVSALQPVGQLATLMMFNENYLAGNITTRRWLDFLICSLEKTTDSQMLSAYTRYIGSALLDLTPDEAAPYEQRLWKIADTHPSRQGKTMVLRNLVTTARSPQIIESIYDIWKRGEMPLLSRDDFSDIALHLAIVRPEEAADIIATQRERINDGDRLRKFDFISRAAVSDTLALDTLFESLSDPANRLVEPWTLRVLSLLNHPSRHNRSMRYITPALEMLPQIQTTGDIFFPSSWASSLLGSYRSKEAAETVNRFLKENKEKMNPLLLNKVHQGATRLMLKQR